VIPPKANRKTKRECDFVLYRERNLIERFFNKIKQLSRHCDPLRQTRQKFLAAVQLVSALLN
jgi:transposase